MDNFKPNSIVSVSKVGPIDSLRAHCNIERLCSQYNISDDELGQIVNDRRCIKLTISGVPFSCIEIAGTWENVKYVLVDKIKNTIGSSDDISDLLAYSSGALYTTVAHSMHSQIRQTYDNQGLAHWLKNSKRILVLKVRHSFSALLCFVHNLY
jgi:hypothetical protein